MPAQTPIASALDEALCNFPLNKEYFLRILYARMKDLYVSQPKTLAEVHDYVENTSSSLVYLFLQILKVSESEKEVIHAASHIGRGMGIVTLLRAIPHHIKKGNLYIPQEFTIKHGVSQEQIFRGEINENVRQAVYEMANIARGHIQNAREMKSKIPKKAYLAFLSASFGDDYLEKLQKSDFNPLQNNILLYGFKPRFQSYKNYYLSSY